MTRKRLFLHIGTHKTGTTSFQESLLKNAPALIARGLRPIREPRMRQGIKRPGLRASLFTFAELFMRPDLLTGARFRQNVPNLTPPQRRNRLKVMAKRLNTLDDPALLLSTEALCFLRTPTEQNLMREFLAGIDRDVTTLVTFRSTGDWRASWLSQLAKSPDLFDAVHARPPENRITADWYFDKNAIRQFWGPFGLREFSYEQADDMLDVLYGELGIVAGELAPMRRLNLRRVPGPNDPTPK